MDELAVIFLINLLTYLAMKIDWHWRFFPFHFRFRNRTIVWKRERERELGELNNHKHTSKKRKTHTVRPTYIFTGAIFMRAKS